MCAGENRGRIRRAILTADSCRCNSVSTVFLRRGRIVHFRLLLYYNSHGRPVQDAPGRSRGRGEGEDMRNESQETSGSDAGCGSIRVTAEPVGRMNYASQIEGAIHRVSFAKSAKRPAIPGNSRREEKNSDRGSAPHQVNFTLSRRSERGRNPGIPRLLADSGAAEKKEFASFLLGFPGLNFTGSLRVFQAVADQFDEDVLQRRLDLLQAQDAAAGGHQRLHHRADRRFLLERDLQLRPSSASSWPWT